MAAADSRCQEGARGKRNGCNGCERPRGEWNEEETPDFRYRGFDNFIEVSISILHRNRKEQNGAAAREMRSIETSGRKRSGRMGGAGNEHDARGKEMQQWRRQDRVRLEWCGNATAPWIGLGEETRRRGGDWRQRRRGEPMRTARQALDWLQWNGEAVTGHDGIRCERTSCAGGEFIGKDAEAWDWQHWRRGDRIRQHVNGPAAKETKGRVRT